MFTMFTNISIMKKDSIDELMISIKGGSDGIEIQGVGSLFKITY